MPGHQPPSLLHRTLSLVVMGLIGLGVVVKLTSAQQSPHAEKPTEHAKHEHKGHGDAHKNDGKHANHDHHAEHQPDPLEHVLDSTSFHISPNLGIDHIDLPFIGIGSFGFQLTKYMVLELIAAVLICLIFIPLAHRAADGSAPRGAWWNAFDTLLQFVREEIAKPSIGHHADHFLPLLWTLFLFILFNNLLGMIPFMGSATANINVTFALAFVVFCAIHGGAIKEMGLKHYAESYWPHFDVPFPLDLIIKPLVMVIEIVGVLVRNLVLAVRLFANVFAGHMVLAVILIFIYAAKDLHPALWGLIATSSVFGILALSLLEIFVAFLQAYIFTFLAALFIGMAIHPAH